MLVKVHCKFCILGKIELMRDIIASIYLSFSKKNYSFFTAQNRNKSISSIFYNNIISVKIAGRVGGFNPTVFFLTPQFNDPGH